MCTAVTLAVIAVIGNNVVLHGYGPVHAAEKTLAVIGKGVGGPDQRPDDDQNPSYAQQGGFGQFVSNNTRRFFTGLRALSRATA